MVSVLMESVSLERTGERAKPMIEKRREVEKPLTKLDPRVRRRWRPRTSRARAMAPIREDGVSSFLSNKWWTLQKTSTQQTCQEGLGLLNLYVSLHFANTNQ